MNNMRLEWCEDCKAIDNGEIKDFCHKHFIPNRNSPHYGPFAFKNGPNWYIGKEIEPKPEEINEEPIKCPCAEEMESYKRSSGNVKIEMKCSLCGRIEYTFGNYEGKCIVGGIKQDGEANE